MVREVFDDAARDRFVGNVAGHILGGVKEETLPRVFDYWKNIDSETGKRVEEAVRSGRANAVAPHETPAEGVVGSPAHR
jgi:catalase